MRVKSARSIRKGASSGQTAASLVENHARKPPSSALIANHASKPALFEVPISVAMPERIERIDDRSLLVTDYPHFVEIDTK
jgi:hypothetical protein